MPIDKLLILDKDGTLTCPKNGGRFPRNPKDQELLPGVASALAHYRKEGWGMAIASNQGGVDAGFKTYSDARAELFFAMRLTGINAGYFCTSNRENEAATATWLTLSSDREFAQIIDPAWLRVNYPHSVEFQGFRKPAPGMLQAAIANCYWPPREVLMVGDMESDRQAAHRAGASFSWVSEWLAPFISEGAA